MQKCYAKFTESAKMLLFMQLYGLFAQIAREKNYCDRRRGNKEDLPEVFVGKQQIQHHEQRHDKGGYEKL